MANMIAVQGDVAGAGATTWWGLHGDVRGDALERAWRAQGLETAWLPEPTTPAQRLGRAVRSVSSLRKLARPVERRGHWACVTESVAGEGAQRTVAHETTLTAWVTASGGVEFSTLLDPAPAIAGAFAASLGWLTRDDVALWLADVIKRVYGTPLRDRGGVYYVPPTQVATWRQVAAALDACGAGRVYTLPTVQGEDCALAVLDALTRDVGGDLDTLVEQAETRSVGGRALRARARDCDEVLRRLEQYAGVLGTSLDALRERVLVAQDLSLTTAWAIEAEAASADDAATAAS